MRGTELHDLAARILWSCGIIAAVDWLLAPRLCLLMFHRATRPEEWPDLPNRDFYLDTSFLDRLLSHLKRTGRQIVTLDELLREHPNSVRRLVNISVDDTYRDTHELVVPIFRRHGVPVTLFVQTGIPDGALIRCGRRGSKQSFRKMTRSHSARAMAVPL